MKLIVQISVLLLLFNCFAQKNSCDLNYYSIIELDTAQTWGIKYKKSTKAVLSTPEIIRIDSILKVCIAENNNNGKPHIHGKHIGNYTFVKQLVPVINERGEKVVWVNCICDQFIEQENADRAKENKKDPAFYQDWKKQVIIVHDGGNRFWNVQVNLNHLTYSDLYVNGM